MIELKIRDFSASGLYITYDILSENKEVGRITVEYYSHDTVKMRNLFVKSLRFASFLFLLSILDSIFAHVTSSSCSIDIVYTYPFPG